MSKKLCVILTLIIVFIIGNIVFVFYLLRDSDEDIEEVIIVEEEVISEPEEAKKDLARFVDNQDGTVSDSLTALMWAADGEKEGANYGEKLNWQDSMDYCNNLTFAGYNDWYLPSIEGLESIIYDIFRPRINPVYFPNTQSNFYWSSTKDEIFSDHASGANFSSDYVIGYSDKSHSHYLRCVRQCEECEEAKKDSDRFIDNQDGTVSDPLTGVMWAADGKEEGANYGEKLNWQDSMDYCNNLTFAGYNDWYLPSIEELESIFDDDYFRNIAINTDYFPNTRTWGVPFYWSSTELALYPDNAWIAFFTFGDVNHFDKNYFYYLRCVRQY